jgi:hypothetical protein
MNIAAFSNRQWIVALIGLASGMATAVLLHYSPARHPRNLPVNLASSSGGRAAARAAKLRVKQGKFHQ